MPTIKPLDEEIILTAARECRRIITVEELNVLGGLGEAVCGVLSEKLPCLRPPHGRAGPVRPLRPRRRGAA